jgi:hypothetical protein
MPRGIAESGVKSAQWYVCTEGFVVGLDKGDVWFRAGQRVREDNLVFQPSKNDPEGQSAKNRMSRFFLPEGEA